MNAERPRFLADDARGLLGERRITGRARTPSRAGTRVPPAIRMPTPNSKSAALSKRQLRRAAAADSASTAASSGWPTDHGAVGGIEQHGRHRLGAAKHDEAADMVGGDEVRQARELVACRWQVGRLERRARASWPIFSSSVIDASVFSTHRAAAASRGGAFGLAATETTAATSATDTTNLRDMRGILRHGAGLPRRRGEHGEQSPRRRGEHGESR